MKIGNNFTVAVTHFVKKESEEEFELALNQVIAKARRFIGYQGIQTVKLNDALGNEYLLLVRFDNEANYKEWEESDVRNDWAKELQRFVIRESKLRYQEGIEFWFSSPNQTNSIKNACSVIDNGDSNDLFSNAKNHENLFLLDIQELEL